MISPNFVANMFINNKIKFESKHTHATHIYVEVQGHAEVMNVHNLLSQRDTLMCQIWYDCVKEQR